MMVDALLKITKNLSGSQKAPVDLHGIVRIDADSPAKGLMAR